MKASLKGLVAASLFLAPAASYATKVPIPIEGATLNLSVQVQTQFLVNQNGTPDGSNPSFDIYVRRTRLLVNGDISQNFTYLFQLDNPLFGKFGNFTGRAIVQDAWVGWAPTGITGGTVFYVDAGILLIPISHHLLESTTNFVTADVQTDGFRFTGSGFPNLRDTGIQVRGWALDKKIGFRGGVYEGYAPILQAAGTCTGAVGTCITPKRNPMFGVLVNIDIIGSEEGGWLYGAYKWGKDPILSVGAALNYQSLAVRNFAGNLSDQSIIAPHVYLNFPMTEQAELVGEGTLYVNSNGSNTASTGIGISGNLGYRFGNIAPYVAYDYFAASDCDAGSLSAAQLITCQAQGAGAPHSADSRNFKAGINYFVNKNLNHVNLEFQENHGQSGFGPGSITAANAGYVPLALDPAVAGGPRRAFSANLRNPAFWSILVHWNVLF